MSYIVNRTDGNVIATILDGTTNSDTGITLIGRNFTSYGEIQNENFVRLLENFADTIPPGQSVGFNPLPGTLWWDTGNQLLKVYNGSSFIPVSQRAVSATVPDVIHVGDQWWNTTTNQLSVWTGTDWVLVGPMFTAAQGKSGALVESIIDNFGVAQTVINNYTNGHLISITSYSTFIPGTPIAGFEDIIRPGINLPSTMRLNATANNSVRVGGVYANVLARTDINNTLTGDNRFDANLVIGSANVLASGDHLLIKNNSGSGNVEIHVGYGNTKAMSISGTTGRIRVAHSPEGDDELANKGYVDQAVGTTVAYIGDLSGQIEANVNQVLVDYQGNIVTVINATNANLFAAQTGINSNVNALNDAFLSNVGNIGANLGTATRNISTLANITANKANINSPVFSGNPQAPQTKALVDYFIGLGPALNPYQLNLSSNIGVNVGDVISQLDAHTLVTLANLTVHANARGNTVSVTVTSGSLTPGIQSLQSSVIEINGLLVQPAVYVETISYLGPDIQYHGVGDYSNTISTTMYVDTTANLLYSDYNTKLSNIDSRFHNDLAVAVAPLAPKASPTFTGTATYSGTIPAGDNSTKLATTAYVQGEITSGRSTWMGSKFTVSTSQPDGGDDGDFWFVIG